MVGQTPVLRILENVCPHIFNLEHRRCDPHHPQFRFPEGNIRLTRVASSDGACSRWSAAASCGGVENVPCGPCCSRFLPRTAGGRHRTPSTCHEGGEGGKDPE